MNDVQVKGESSLNLTERILMSAELVFASVAISLALFFYTWGVFGERRGGTLSLKYVLLFWIGLACDTTGTLTMSNIASPIRGLRLRHPCHHGRRGHRAHAGACALGHLHL